MLQQNYANPDEALFSSANRPRDQYGFKILPEMRIGGKLWELLIEKVLIRLLKEKYDLTPKKKK